MAEMPNATLAESIYKRFHYTCIYCGFDGRVFDSWMQLSIDHILPRSSGGTNDAANLTVACRSCNSITSRMKFSSSATRKEIILAKRKKVAEHRKDIYEYWQSAVAPNHLKRPLQNVR